MQTWTWTDPYCRCSKWLSLAAAQAVKRLMKFATALLMWSCGSSSQMVCKATFNSSIVLCFGWGIYDIFQHGAADVIVQWVQIWRLWGPLILFNERRTDCLQPVLRGECRVRWDAVLLEDEVYTADQRCQCVGRLSALNSASTASRDMP